MEVPVVKLYIIEEATKMLDILIPNQEKLCYINNFGFFMPMSFIRGQHIQL